MARSELSRLRNNLKKKIGYYNNKGYDIDKSFVDSLTLDEIRSIDTQTLLKDIYYEQQAAKYEDETEDDWQYDVFPDEVDMIISEFRDSYSKYNAEATQILDRWLNNLIVLKGDVAVAQMISDATANGLTVSSNIIYGNLIESFIMDFMDYLPDEDQLGVNEMADLFDSLEQQEDWGNIT